MKARKNLRVFVFEETARLREVLSLYLTLRGYEPVVFSGLTYCAEEPWRQGPLQSDGATAGVAISDLSVPVSTLGEFLEPRIKKQWGIKQVALMPRDWTENDEKLASELGIKLFDKPFSLDQLNEWLDEVAGTSDSPKMLPLTPDKVSGDLT